MGKFKVGDRVRVYGHVKPELGHYHHDGISGKIELIMSDTELLVELYSCSAVGVHPRQCRKLVKKRKPEVPANLDVNQDHWYTTVTNSINFLLDEVRRGRGKKGK